MLFRDMLGEPCHEIKNGDGFLNQFAVFMAVVMKRNKFAVIGVNAGSCDHRTSEITANVFDHMRRAAVIRHGANIKTIFMIRIDRSLKFFKRVPDPGM